MKNQILKLTAYNDPAHGWLRVSHQTLVDLGVQHAISGYSYMTSRWVYLEEDSDAAKFLDACKANGIEVKIADKYSNSPSTIRGYGQYKPEFLGGLNLDDIITSGTLNYMIVDTRHPKYYVANLSYNGVLYRIPKQTYSDFTLVTQE